MEDDQLVELVEQQRTVMISVSTGGYNNIDRENPEYKSRRERIREALHERGLDDPNPHFDLWRWYAKWHTDLPQYNMRRSYVDEIYDPLVEKIRRIGVPVDTNLFPEPTGWERVDSTVQDIKQTLIMASTEVQFQAVGHYCRDCLISVAQAILNSDGSDTDSPSITDAKVIIDAYLGRELSGGSNEEIRRHTKAAVSLTSALVHMRTANFRDAAICAEASISVVNLLAIISGRRRNRHD